MNPTMKTAVFWAVIVVSAFLLWQMMKSGTSAHAVPEISYSDFLAKVESDEVSKVTIANGVVHGTDTKGGSFLVVAPPDQRPMIGALQQHRGNLVQATARTELAELAPQFGFPGSSRRLMVFHDPSDATAPAGCRTVATFSPKSAIRPALRRMTSVTSTFPFCWEKV